MWNLWHITFIRRQSISRFSCLDQYTFKARVCYFVYPFDFIYQLNLQQIDASGSIFLWPFWFKLHQISSPNYISLYLLFWKYYWRKSCLISFFPWNLFSCVNLPCLWWRKLNTYHKYRLHISIRLLKGTFDKNVKHDRHSLLIWKTGIERTKNWINIRNTLDK